MEFPMTQPLLFTPPAVPIQEQQEENEDEVSKKFHIAKKIKK